MLSAICESSGGARSAEGINTDLKNEHPDKGQKHEDTCSNSMPQRGAGDRIGRIEGAEVRG